MHFEAIDRVIAGSPILLDWMRKHPRVVEVHEDVREQGLTFHQGNVARHISVGDASEPLKGLVELMDNNPLVCANRFGVPDSASTLALIALGPLAEAGLMLEAPVFTTNLPARKTQLRSFLATAGWTKGVTLGPQEVPFDGMAVATAIAAIQTPSELDDLDALYEERFGRSFFIRLNKEAKWDSDMVMGTPYALYALRITTGEESSLLTIQVMADRNGKCGATQIVHAMNVMAGFEETIGLEEVSYSMPTSS